MNNKYLSDSLKSKELTTDSKKIISSGLTLLGKTMDSITSIPIFDFVSSISDGVIAIREYRILKMIAHFFESFDSLNWEERMEFSYRLQTNEEYEDFTEKILFYLESLQDKQKATWIGKMAIGLAKNKISMQQFDLSVFAIQNSMADDLILLQKIFNEGLAISKETSEQDNPWYCNYLYQHISLRYWDDLGENQTIPRRVRNNFLLIGLLDRELKEVKKSSRGMGFDGDLSFVEGIKEKFSFTEIALLMYLLALKTNI